MTLRASRRTTITLTLCVGVFMSSLDVFIVNIAFPDISRSFAGTGLGTLSWVLSAYAIVFAALLVPAGRWADRSGRKRAFVAGMALFSAASAACAAAPSVAVLVAARGVQAAGAALMMPTSLALLLPEYPPARRPAAIGIWAAVGGVAAACGPSVGGLLVQAGWRWVFIVNVPIGAVTVLAASRLLRERREPAGARPDLAGAGMFTVATAALTAAIVQGHAWGWGSARVLGLLVLTVLLAAALAVRSSRHPAPLIEPAIIRTRAIALANLGGLLFFAAFGMLLLSSVLFQTTVWHDSVLRAGLQITPGPAMAAVFAFPGGVLGQRFGQRYVGAVGALLFASGALWFRTHMGASADYANAMLPAQLLSGIGVGLTLPTLSAAATAPLPPARFATGSAVLGMSRQLGTALGVAILVAILGSPAPTGAVAAFRDGWTVMALVALAASVTLLSVGPVRLGAALAQPEPGAQPQRGAQPEPGAHPGDGVPVALAAVPSRPA